MNVAVSSHATQPWAPIRSGAPFSQERLTALLMDDNQFDRKKIARLAKKSRYDIELIETSTIAESRAAMDVHHLDLIFLDFRVPDGDGISFLRELGADGAVKVPPAVIITGEGDEAAAIRSLRSGAVDYLPKEALSLDEFDGAISAAMMSGHSGSATLETQFEEIRDELAVLRRKTNQNMNLARTYLLPMAQYAWSSIGSVPETQRETDATRLARITRSLTGLLDETLVQSVAETGQAGPEPVQLHALLEEVIGSSARLAGSANLAPEASFPTVTARRDHLVMLFRELCADAVAQTPRNTEPCLRIDCAQDPAGNPIIRIVDNGPPLSVRQQMLADRSKRIAGQNTHPVCQGMTFSLCQRLAEMTGAKLRIADNEGGGCVTMIRFSPHH